MTPKAGSGDGVLSSPAAVYQTILFPSETKDYVVKRGKFGLGLFAARDIQKGEVVFENSLEYCYADVVDGDDILFVNCRNRSKTENEDTQDTAGIPSRIPSTRDMLLRTHGVEYLEPDETGKTAGIVCSMLEVPGMLMNHSCDPCVINPEGWGSDAEDVAARDIKKGEELTFDYITFEDESGVDFDCACGADSCRGPVRLFEDLPEKEQKRLMPFINDVLRAQLEFKAERGLPLDDSEEPTFPPRIDSGVPRLVFSGPSCAEAKVAVRQDEKGEFGLYALKDFRRGNAVYEFWRQPWPLVDSDKRPEPFDMVFAAPMEEGDPPEGTVVRVDPINYGAETRSPISQFSGWDLVATHDSNPNMEYDDDDEGDSNWSTTYATREIKTGEKLTVDYNCR